MDSLRTNQNGTIMKHIFFFLLLFANYSVFAQKYYTKTGSTEFKASVEAFEPVEATNNSTTAILNTSTGEVASLLFVKSFHFKVALMEEHFNENYMDSDKYPKATFKGKLKDFQLDKLTDQASQLALKGDLTIRGKSKAIDTVAHLKKAGDKIIVTSEFEVEPGEFDIEIPGIVKEKIAKSIKILVHYELVKKG